MLASIVLSAFACSPALAAFNHKNLVVPKPAASDGKYTSHVLVKWTKSKGATFYKVRRATSKDYSKSKVIATVTGKSYKDKHPAATPRKKYYYWVVPYVSKGKGRKDVSLYDKGHVKQLFSVINQRTLFEYKGSYAFKVQGNPGETIDPGDCTWELTKGSKIASISDRGVLTVKKAGMIVVKVTYNGVSITMPITSTVKCCACGQC